MDSGLASFRSRLTLIALLLLPALVYRALIPAGFMPMRDADGRLAIMFCPGVGAGAPAAQMPQGAEHAQHHHHGTDAPAAAGHDHAAQAQNVCPFALSAGPALAYSVPVQAASFATPESAEPSHYSSIRIAAIQRAQSARAPPASHRV